MNSRVHTRAYSIIMLVVLLSACPSPGEGRIVTIKMFLNNFVPEAVTIGVGDTVRWQWVQGQHTVTSGRLDGEPGTLDAPGTLFNVVLEEKNPVFEFRFEELREGGFYFFDRQHPDQVGFIDMGFREMLFQVWVRDHLFFPPELWIFEGDSIKWQYEFMGAFHTVTSGLSSNPEDKPGELFDEECSDAKPTVVFRFESASKYPYFCRQHESTGMTGIINVQKKFIRGDANGDGAVDISDAVCILGNLFLGTEVSPCIDALDANDDGVVDIADPISLLTFLFLGDEDVPLPYPISGADRTDDNLLCELAEF